MKLKKFSRLKCYQVVFFVIINIFYTNSFAKDLYVSNSGSDSISYENNNINNPWVSPEKAWYSARAGDTVYFRGGSYSITSEIDTRSVGYDGTEASPIIFTNYQNESVTFNCGTLDPVFSIERSWNVVDSINFEGGRTVFRVGYNTSAIHFTAQNCTSHLALSTDNHAFVLLTERAEYATIQNCTIRGPGAGANTNVVGILAYHVIGFKALHNEIYDVPRGIYFKHGDRLPDYDTGIEIAYNYVHDTGHQGMFFNCSYASIHDNLFGLNNGTLQFNSANGGSNGEYNNFYHNTIYNTSIIIDEDLGNGKYNTIKDNIFMALCNIYKYSSGAHYTAMDYNLYPSGNIVCENKTNYTLSTWQSHNSSDANSLSGSPTFVGGGSPSSIADFALANGSTGENAASDGRDMGADISLVGPGGSEDPAIGSSPYTPKVDSVKIAQENFGPEVIFHDEFEDSTPMSEKYTEYNSHNGDCTVTDTEGFGGSPRSLMANWQQGQVDAGGLVYMFGRNPSASESHSDTDFRDIYWRFYLKTSKGWTGNPRKLTRATIIATPNWAQAMIAHIWGSEGTDLLKIDPATGIDSNNNLATTTYNDFNNLNWLGIKNGITPIYDTSMGNTWHCIEGHVKLNTPGNSNGVFEFWIDGNLEARRDDLNWVGSWQEYGINTIMFANYWNEGAPQAQQRFMDNIVVSTEHIGLAPSPVNPIIFKTAFEDPDPGDIQSVFEAQVSTTPDTSGIVWTGGMSGNGDNLGVDTSTGSFQGALSGATSLSQATIYYARVRYADDSGKYSDWSPWKIFRTEGSGKPSIPPWFK